MIVSFDGESPLVWRVIAGDGAARPPARVQDGPSVFGFVDLGTTHEVLWTPTAPADLTLRVVTEFLGSHVPGRSLPPAPDHVLDIPVRVR